MWVWNTQEILQDTSESALFLSAIANSGASQVYLYLPAKRISAQNWRLRQLVGDLRRHNVLSYAMDGDRGFFFDAFGPGQLYAGISNVVAYNDEVAANERFVGYMLDVEPQDGQGSGQPLFHNGIAESNLTIEQRHDRDMLMIDWLSIHDRSRRMLHAANLRLASSVPFWTDMYYNEPIMATYRGKTEDVTRFLMELVDDYCIMSYSTWPSEIINKIASKLQYATTLRQPPRIYGGVETHPGAGSGVSYSDTLNRASRMQVIEDMNIVTEKLNSTKLLAGINVHDWIGWKGLAPCTAGYASSVSNSPSGWHC